MSSLELEEFDEQSEYIDICTLTFDDTDEASLRSTYESVDINVRRLLAMSEGSVNYLLDSLSGSAYVPAFRRRYINLLSGTLEDEGSALRADFSRPRESPDIDKVGREIALKLVVKWKRMIIEDGLIQENAWFYRNGKPTGEFKIWLESQGVIGVGELDNESNEFTSRGSLEPDVFFQRLDLRYPDWREYGVNFDYAALPEKMEDESSHSGNPLSCSFPGNDRVCSLLSPD